MKEIQDMFYKFLWDGKPDKIKRNVIINNYEEGGLKLPHIESFCKVLKMSWLYKLEYIPMETFTAKLYRKIWWR
jgi:hypothetical protein